LKVLDEKGRLFGKINLVDFAVVVGIVLVVGAVGWKLMGDKVTSAAQGFADTPVLRYEVVCYNINPEIAEYAESHVDTQLMSNGDMLNATIVDATVKPSYAVALDADGNAVQIEDPSMRTVHFTIEAKVAPTANAYAVGSQEIRVGKTHIVKTVLLEVAGFIATVEEVPEETADADVTADE